MKRVRFLMIGGFLGAGKTTAIARLARHYMDQELNVGLVTNDQAYNLVDTESLRAQGFRVGEVPGACFCCKFDDLVDTVSQLSETDAPDVIIAEPVGSCTDLVATVIEPMRHLYADRFEVGRLAVLLKPEHGRKILSDGITAGFSPKAAYIFLKQIEEADIVAINKIDKLTDSQQQELLELVKQRFPEKEVVAVSAREGNGFGELIEAIDEPAYAHKEFMDVDYDVYAEGEAELGWLNCQVRVESDGGVFSLDELLVSLVGRLRDGLAALNAEPAHLKIMGQTPESFGVANLVDSASDVDLSLASEVNTASADLTINARVAFAPEDLEQVVTTSVAYVAVQFGLTHAITGMQRFRPGRPVPTHRMTAND